ncbi:MAG: hypothetical protein WC457_00240 [Patescibacteria group bacterium]
MPNKIENEIERLLKSFKQKKLPVEIELLALHENAGKLWAAHRERKNKEEVKKHLANCYIMLYNIANKLKIHDIDSVVLNRIEQIESSPKNKKKK